MKTTHAIIAIALMAMCTATAQDKADSLLLEKLRIASKEAAIATDLKHANKIKEIHNFDRLMEIYRVDSLMRKCEKFKKK